MNGMKQVFLGGACGGTSWRATVAIPLLEAAGVSYHDPQLGPGEWTEAHEAEDMVAKTGADVLLFVISGETRGVASIAEVAYLLAAGRPLALCLRDVAPGAVFEGRVVDEAERADLNRGRLFLRTLAAAHGVPVFADEAGAAAHAVELCRRRAPLSAADLGAILDEIELPGHRLASAPAPGGFLLWLEREEPDADTGVPACQEGRRWFVAEAAGRGDVLRTVLKAALAWQEHSVREALRYRGERVFGPHHDVDQLVALCRSAQERGPGR
jgi:hypothetical protein